MVWAANNPTPLICELHFSILGLSKGDYPLRIIRQIRIYLFPILEVGYFISPSQSKIMGSLEETLMKIRDPLFVIETSLEIIKQRGSDTKIEPEIKRIEAALDRIVQIIK
jgi:hypothetical protein